MKTPSAILLLLGAALALRCGVAVVDHVRPLFPPHHYGDARSYDASGKALVEFWRNGGTREHLPPGRGLYVISTAALYRIAGEHPLLPRLVNALLGTVSLYLWYRFAAAAASPAAALLSLAFLAFWPSHVFYTSQHLKESSGLLMLWGAFLGVAGCLPGAKHGARGRTASLSAGLASLFLFGFLRSTLATFAAAALMAGCAAGAFQDRGDPRRARAWAVPFLCLLAAALLFGPAVNRITPHLSGSPTAAPAPGGKISPFAGEAPSPFTPEGLSWVRRSRLHSNRHWSIHHAHREIRTEIFPNAEFHSWLDVILFIPKAAFHSLFMPLPGLYPIEGNPGRAAAAAENAVLLAVALAAALGWRGVRKTPMILALAAFLVLMIPAWSFFEFDLGGAVRHRLIVFPPLILFASSWLVDRLPARRAA